MSAEREMLGKKPIEDDDDDDDPNGGETVEKTVSTTDPDCGMFVKGEHERQFAYEAHTACDKRGFVPDVEVTAGNIHDSVAWDKIYADAASKFMPGEKKPLSVSLRMQKRDTKCVIHTTEAWPQSLDGSGSSLLP